MIVQGERVCLYLFILIFFTVEREGVKVNVFFLLHLTCARRRGRGLLFFIIFFFIIEWLRKGVMVFFLLICGRGMGGGMG